MNQTTVANLAEEVALLLRHDNLDNRINQWLALAFNDIASRKPDPLFSSVTTATIAASATSVTITDQVGTPRAAMAVDTNGVLYIPTQLAPTDYGRISTSESTAPPGNPRYWLIEKSGATMKLKVWPSAATETYYTIIWSGNPVTSELAGTDYLNIPYWAESVVIWHAAAIGAAIVRPDLAPLFTGEAEQLIQDMYWIIGLKPDSVPILREISSPYGQSPRMAVPPRLPETIS